MWRMRHYLVVARIIGDSVVGTQGTPVELLGGLIKQRFYPELWQARNRADRAGERGRVTLRDEVTQLLQELIRLDTVNPPGNETQAAELLRDYLAGHGVESELYARRPSGRTSSPGCRAAATARACCCSRTRTPSSPTRPSGRSIPGRARSADSELWGRGALDMKGQVAAEAVAIASLAREGFEPAGDLVFSRPARTRRSATASASQWLCEHHPEAVRTDYALNEGAGERMELFGRTFYLCSSAEKMSSPFRLLVHGRAGHASVPGIADNALVKAAPLIERLAAYRPELRLGPETTAMIKAVAGRELEPARRSSSRASDATRPPPSCSSRCSR